MTERRISDEMSFEMRLHEDRRFFRSHSHDMNRRYLRRSLSQCEPTTPITQPSPPPRPLLPPPTISAEDLDRLVLPPPPVLIYPNLRGDLLKTHADQMRKLESMADPTRFTDFVSNMPVKPHQVVSSFDGNRPKDINMEYATPRIRFETPSGNTRPPPNEEDYHKKNYEKTDVESTLIGILKDISAQTESSRCPFGMNERERQKFCLNLDLLGENVSIGKAWRVFAQRVIPPDLLNNDDLELIERFSFKYKYPVVEILLKHWHKLFTFASDAGIKPAVKATIKDELFDMEQFDILDRVGWWDDENRCVR